VFLEKKVLHIEWILNFIHMHYVLVIMINYLYIIINIIINMIILHIHICKKSY